MFRYRRSVLEVLNELSLPRAEREAARAEREMRSQRDNEHTPERRAAAIEAELGRYSYRRFRKMRP